jgi:hypothetical protein
VAAALAFPDGSMTASGLRREAARGRLVIERIAGKDYTTLANIERMREQCRVEQNPLASISETVLGESQTGSFSTLERKLARVRAKGTAERLKQHLKNT